MPNATLFADSFRSVVTSILFSGRRSDPPGVIVVTSTSAGEGKTTVACNLGITLAEIGMRVLLIDGDCCRHQLRRLFDIDGKALLTELLSNSTPMPPLGVQTRVANLRVLASDGSETSNLLYSARLAELLNTARQQNDVVLVDTPPMLLMPDARVFGRLADGVILVLRAGSTPLDAALMARQRLADDGTKVLGTVLNDWNPSNSDQPGYKKSYRSYQRYRRSR